MAKPGAVHCQKKRGGAVVLQLVPKLKESVCDVMLRNLIELSSYTLQYYNLQKNSEYVSLKWSSA